MEEFYISSGDLKMGVVPSFSLPSGQTCSLTARKTCNTVCLAMARERVQPGLAQELKRNFTMATLNRKLLERRLMEYFGREFAPKLFRIHLSGDFFNKGYFEMWMRIVTANPRTKFLAFTKQCKVVGAYLDSLPSNFIIVWSAWPGVPVPRIFKDRPIAWLQDGTETRVPKDAVRCSGMCDECGHCWTLEGKDVVFNLR